MAGTAAVIQPWQVQQPTTLQGGGVQQLQGSSPNLQTTAPAGVLQTATSIAPPPRAAAVAPPPVDPNAAANAAAAAQQAQYAAQQAAAAKAAADAKAAAIAGITGTNNAIIGQASTQAGGSASDLLNGGNGLLGILPTIQNLKLGQNNVDQEHVQNNLAKTQGLNGVLQMVSRGIQSGGVQLANNNASNSSAAEALARAYGIQGRDAASQVGNQFGIAENKAGQDQMAQDASVSNSIGTLKQNKTDAINSIVNNAVSALTSLNTYAGALGVTGVVNVDGEKQAILQDAMKQLSQYDSQIEGATPGRMAPEDIAAKASQLATAGTAAAEPFNYTTTGPAQFQDTGPSPSPLPIFVAPRKTALT